MKKTWIWSGVIVLIIIGLFFVFIWPMGESWRQKYLAHQILSEYAALDNAYRTDPYGSTTPEGTLELFVSALKKGDADLASNYFLPEKKEVGLSQTKMIIANNRTTEVAKELENYKDRHYINNEMTFVMATYYQEEKAWSETTLKLNKYSQKWLIESL